MLSFSLSLSLSLTHTHTHTCICRDKGNMPCTTIVAPRIPSGAHKEGEKDQVFHDPLQGLCLVIVHLSARGENSCILALQALM